MSERTVFYKAELRWVPISAPATYFVEITEDGMTMSNEVDEPYFEHFTEGAKDVHVKVTLNQIEEIFKLGLSRLILI